MDPLIRIGKISKTHGLDGFVRVALSEALSENLVPDAKVFIGKSENTSDLYQISEVRRVHDGILVSFSGIREINQVRLLTGLSVYVTERDLKETEPDDSLAALTGFTVSESRQKKKLGEIESIWDSPAHPILVVRTPKGSELLIPLVESWIVSVSRKKRVLELNLPEGLADDPV